RHIPMRNASPLYRYDEPCPSRLIFYDSAY
ncbi:unnamed protein product, partial [Rotaria sp. Silwood1]